MNILFSQSSHPTFELPTGQQGRHRFHVSLRPSYWGIKGVRKRLFHIQSAIRIGRWARRFDALALCTVGIEAFFVSRFKKALCPRTRLVCADFLMPRPGKSSDSMRTWLGNIDRMVCIRTGDIATLEQRFGVPADKCRFAYFPANAQLEPLPADGDYLYAAGNAFRDWPLLLHTLEESPWRAILSPGLPLDVPASLSGRVEVRAGLGPEQGRALLRQARAVAMPLQDTPLPSGPLVLLDAMMMGQAVVATSVNGTRDYIADGRTALVVPPGDAAAMAQALTRLHADETLRQQLGGAAREEARTRFSTAGFVQSLVEACEG